MRCLLALLLAAERNAATTNPFAEHPFYLNPVNQAEYDNSIEIAPNDVIRQNLQTMRGIASAYWIDKKNKIRGETTHSVEGILADAAAKSPPELVVLIWYDFPNRDCAAAASAGEICCAYKPDGTCDWGKGGDCSSGIDEYKTGYVDPFIDVLVEYRGRVPVVIVFEPDSLPNFATNLDKPHCGALETRNAYKEGAKYALTRLTGETDATVYIDAAHGGWLGWSDNLMKYLANLKELDLPWDKIRGFSTNVAGYQPLGEMCPWQPDAGQPYRNGYCLNGKHKDSPCCSDPCNLLSQWDPADNELNYAQELHHAAKGELGMDAHIIIDTGRNGVPGPRKSCENWCNIRGAGAGHASSADVPDSGIMDAFFYLKTPGESDGCTQTLPDGSACPRFDTGCGSADSLGSIADEPRAPEAGAWFEYQVRQLAELADFGSPFPSSAVPAPGPPSPSAHRAAPAKEPPAPPTPLAPPAPSTPAGKGCCWGPSCSQVYKCETPPGWCSQSESQCTSSCGGVWCPAEGATADLHQSKTRRHRSLRAKEHLVAGGEQVLLQRGFQAAQGDTTVAKREVGDEL